MSFNDGENVLGINHETIAKIPIIGNPTCEILDYRPQIKLDVPNDKKQLRVEWHGNQAINGGKISFMFSDRITPDGNSEGGGKFLVTNHYTAREDYWHNSPHEGVASIFTSLATINRAAELSGDEIHHVVVANLHTVKFFERLKKVGLYTYADLNGEPVDKAQKTYRGILFTTKFPIKGLSKVLGEFEIEKASNLINNLRN